MTPSPADDRTVRVGHWTSPGGRTGCTVVLFGPGTVASGEVRGGAPATREFALLDPRRMVSHVDAVVLSGGSAFGLSAADGVVSWLVERKRGFPTRSGPVPIVVAMALFDLEPEVAPPDVASGRTAVETAADTWLWGRLGAGAGATVGKWRGRDKAVPAGIGYSIARAEGVEVHALIAVNASGDIDDGSTATEISAGRFIPPMVEQSSFENTTIGVVWTNARLDKLGCRLMAESGHDGLGRALVPAHTSADGDALVAASTAELDAPLPIVRLLATIAVEQAVRGSAGAGDSRSLAQG